MTAGGLLSYLRQSQGAFVRGLMSRGAYARGAYVLLSLETYHSELEANAVFMF